MLSRSLGVVSKRAASAASATSVTKSSGATVSNTRLDNGLVVSSVEKQGATSQLVIAYNAGSRYEDADTRGAVHVLRNSIGGDSKAHHSCTLIWNSAELGASITSSSTRDMFAVQVAVHRDNSNIATSLLGEIADPECKPWEIEEVVHDLHKDAGYRCPRAVAIEGLHEAAYRNGPLGNSIYAKRNPSWQSVQQFKNSRFRAGNAVLVGVNVDHDQLVKGALGFRLAEGTGSGNDGKYFGGETRVLHTGSSTTVALAGDGYALTDPAAVAVQAVVAQLLVSVAEKVGANASAVNISYRDAGLIGVAFNAPNNKIGKITKDVAGAIKKVNVSADAVNGAKAKASIRVLAAGELSSNIALDRAVNLLIGPDSIAPELFAQSINQVKEADVTKALNRLTSKLSLSVYGSTAEVPYLDEL